MKMQRCVYLCVTKIMHERVRVAAAYCIALTGAKRITCGRQGGEIWYFFNKLFRRLLLGVDVDDNDD